MAWKDDFWSYNKMFGHVISTYTIDGQKMLRGEAMNYLMSSHKMGWDEANNYLNNLRHI